MTTSALLDRAFEPVGKSLSREAAAEILALRADDDTQRRVDELAEKCNEGNLTLQEREEYSAFLTAMNVISILQAKARQVLANGADRDHE